MIFDAVVVGGGPAGSTAAEIIARNGYDVLILEEHPQVGLPQHCTGKLSINAIKELGLPSIGALQEVRGAKFYSPDMGSLKVERDEVQAKIFDRSILDRYLSDRAVDSGAALLTSAQAVGIVVDANGVNLTFGHGGKRRSIVSRVVISAEGASAPLARLLGIYSKERRALRIAAQREIIGLSNPEPEFVELYFGKKYSPGFFAWIAPMGRDRARVGLCVDPSHGKDVINYLNKLGEEHPVARKRLRGASCVWQAVHVIPTGGVLHDSVSDGVLVVGDAAGQVKSTTGGGLYYGMACAKIAGETVSRALSLEGHVLRKDVLSEYQSLWQQRLGDEIATSAKTRLLLDSLTDEELSYLFKIIREDKSLISLIQAEGDIDWQFKFSKSLTRPIINALARKPSLLMKLGAFLIR